MFILIAGHLRDLNNFWALPATGGFGRKDIFNSNELSRFQTTIVAELSFSPCYIGFPTRFRSFFV